MDATQMSFPDQEFDFVVDKGTLDALLCGSGRELSFLKEVSRVTKENGKLIVISHGSPSMRQQLFAQLEQNHSIKYCKQQLSESAQMINAIRSQLKDKPMMAIFEDMHALQNVLSESSQNK